MKHATNVHEMFQIISNYFKKINVSLREKQFVSLTLNLKKKLTKPNFTITKKAYTINNKVFFW